MIAHSKRNKENQKNLRYNTKKREKKTVEEIE